MDKYNFIQYCKQFPHKVLDIQFMEKHRDYWSNDLFSTKFDVDENHLSVYHDNMAKMKSEHNLRLLLECI